MTTLLITFDKHAHRFLARGVVITQEFYEELKETAHQVEQWQDESSRFRNEVFTFPYNTTLDLFTETINQGN